MICTNAERESNPVLRALNQCNYTLGKAASAYIK